MKKTSWAIVPAAAFVLASAYFIWAHDHTGAGHDAGKDKAQTSAPERSFTSVNIEYKGAAETASKVWVPATFIVYQGDSVKIKLINETPSGQHGFAIDEYAVKATVFNGKPETVEFKADKAGLFRIYCQHHGAHVGGQLLVLQR